MKSFPPEFYYLEKFSFFHIFDLKKPQSYRLYLQLIGLIYYECNYCRNIKLSIIRD